MAKNIFKNYLAATAAIFLAPFDAVAEENFDDFLLGDMAGLRRTLDDKGMSLEVTYKSTLWDVSSDSINSGSDYIDNLDVVLDVDGSKAYGIDGNKLHIYLLNNFGGKPNEDRVGSLDGIDNIETGTNTARLYELWMEQSFMENKVSILAGLYDLNSEFFFNDMSANFLKPVMEVNQEIAQTGQNGPSIFPTTSLAGRIKISPTEDTYLQAVALDGVPGNPDHPHGTHIDFEDNDGLLLAAEIGYTPNATDDGAFDKLAVGVWHYTEEFDDVRDLDGFGNPIKRDSQGVYLIASHVFYKDEAGKSFGGFF